MAQNIEVPNISPGTTRSSKVMMFGRIVRAFHGDFDVRSPIDHLPERGTKKEWTSLLALEGERVVKKLIRHIGGASRKKLAKVNYYPRTFLLPLRVSGCENWAGIKNARAKVVLPIA